MKTIIPLIRPLVLTLLVLASFVTMTLAQEVQIPDPGLNAAIREALEQPNGPLTEQDLLSLINLDASSRDVSSVEGLEAARNLERLFLDSNRLTNFSLPGTLTNLVELNLGSNPLTNCSLPGGLANLATLNIEFCSLIRLTLPTGLTGLTELDLGVNGLTSLAVPADATNLAALSLFFNQLTNMTLPSGLKRLGSLDLDENRLTRLTLPSDLANLESIFLRDNQLSDFYLPAGLSRLSFLALDGNQLTQFTFPAGLTNLSSVGLTGNQLAILTLPPDMQQLDSLFVDGNPLTTLVLSEEMAAMKLAAEVAALRAQGVAVSTFSQAGEVSIPDPELNDAIRQTLQKPVGPLTEQDMLSLTALNACCRNVTNLQGLEAARNLTSLSLDHNLLTDFSIVSGLTNLLRLDLGFNSLTNMSLPSGLTNLATLLIPANRLTHLNLPDGLTALVKLDLDDNQLTRFTLPADMTSLNSLNLAENQLASFDLPTGMTNLVGLFLFSNQLTNVSLPADLAKLALLDVNGNQLTGFALPTGMTNLNSLNIEANALTNFTLPAGLTSLTFLQLSGNRLTSLTLPPDMTQLTSLFLDANPLTTLVLSETLAATNLAATVASLWNQGVSVFTYPLAIQLVRPRTSVGAFQFGITGPPGLYAVLGSGDLAVWNALGVATNSLGSINFTDVTANLSPQKFYRALLQGAPPYMVFIPPNTFTMGSPTNEQDRNINEGPQTTVTLSRGFWIGKYEVTQEEYLAVMNTNPSIFPGDLSRPVTSVSWPDATNYCATLTQREIAAGRIPAGSQYRLPTEAEWECAARAGTSTRFSYGDDPDYTSLPNHAWYASNSGLTPHPVGQKLPNPWGLYDMEGNVVEWCQDWFGSLPGGVQTDPTGPASSASGRKVVRGGAFDNSEQSARSASRLLFSAFPPLTDTDLGFRLVFVTESQ
jgi:formylglycine-generating enzyme required for sulfatase activity